jgi:hypothetical protein
MRWLLNELGSCRRFEWKDFARAAGAEEHKGGGGRSRCVTAGRRELPVGRSTIDSQNFREGCRTFLRGNFWLFIYKVLKQTADRLEPSQTDDTDRQRTPTTRDWG